IQYSTKVTHQLVLPDDTIHLVTLYSGKILAYIDEIAGLAAMKHANSALVTASIDSVDFLSSATVGDALTIEAFVTYTGTSSMEVYLKVTAHYLIKHEITLTTESFLTMVALDENGKPTPVPKVYPETKQEKELFYSAPERKKLRIKRAEKKPDSSLI